MTGPGQRSPLAPFTRALAPVLVLIALITLWQGLVWARAFPATMLPSPLAVASRLGRDLVGGQLLGRTVVTLGEALAGCLLGALIALPLAYALVRWPLVEAGASPFVAASQAVPAVAIAPLLVVWIGYGVAPVVALCVLMVFFPMVLAAQLGLRQLDHDVLCAAALDGAHGWSLAWHIQWPMARRAVMTGLRGGFTLSITGAVVGEFVMGGRGLGLVVSVQTATNDTTGLFATIIVLCLLAALLYLALWLVEIVTDPLRVTAAVPTTDTKEVPA